MQKDRIATRIGATLVCAGIVLAIPVQAAQKAPPRALSKLLDCRAITDSAARLACYDEQVSAIESATEKNEVVVMDKEDVRQTRRSLFGFSMPKLPFLGGGDDDKNDDEDENRVTQIDDTIKNLRAMSYGIWVFTLEDGSQWQTADPMPYGTPKPGLKISIKRAALGSYKASVNGWPAVKIKRVG
ncbi:hypothetical protein [Sphingobium phenoxybenzoativorans]|uniref:hypothetical protein n=1 Tax=Sphingobium phenoxybenzoativorans TaxID=1592790 RepID=UPI0009F1D5AB|nr:hypothetical protein [Sphingobium phenoxybenzoativorans]